MIRYARVLMLFGGLGLLGVLACKPADPPPVKSSLPPTAVLDAFHLPTARDVSAWAASPKVPAPPKAAPPKVAPLLLAGTWVPSGWMGDAAEAKGTLAYRLDHELRDGVPTACDVWQYDPDKGVLGWAAVSSQTPARNWGQEPGKNLSSAGFTRLALEIRGTPGAMVQFKSGGHTAPDAKYPASYESVSDLVVLDETWRPLSIPVGRDLSNVPTALVVIFSRQMAPSGCTLRIRNAAFRGKED